MEQQVYFDNYTRVGDILVLAVCIVMVILIATSFATKTKAFVLFVTMIGYMAAAALADMVMHDWYLYITDGDLTPIYVCRVIYHFCLFTLYLVFIVYLVHMLKLKSRERRPVMIVASLVYIIVLMSDIAASVKQTGFKIDDASGDLSSAWIFLFGYIFFFAFSVCIMLIYRGRIYRNGLIGVIGSMAVSLLILLIQGRHGQVSYTVATFLFPTIALMYLLHANPFNIRTGTVNVSNLNEVVSYCYSKKRRFYFVSVILPGFHSEGKSIPAELQTILREFPSTHFKKAVLFTVSNGHFLLLIPASKNPDFDRKIKGAIEAFQKEYDKYGFDYKLVIGASMEEISRRNEYVSFIDNIQRFMKLNTVHFVKDKDVAEFERDEDILRELEDIHKKQDLNDERVLAYCQPVLNLVSGKYDTAEALMRLKLDGAGIVFPDRFIPLAEEYGYIHTLTRIILHKTCEAISELIGEGYVVNRISVNISVPELRDEGFSGDIESIISSSGIDNEKVAIEITESRSDSDLVLIKGMIEQLKDTGIKFYLDDFGTGYSNMERIMKLPFDIIKFDRSLVIASQSDERSEEIVGRLAGIFADLKYSVLYEGVEDEKDEERCRNMSASYLQGYKYSRPVPIAELRDFFSKTA